MIIQQHSLNLKKRDCNIKMRLVPYGGGWTDVYVTFDKEELYFIITEMWGDNFQTLLRALYFLYPAHTDDEYAEHFMDYKIGYSENDDYSITKIVDSVSELPKGTPFTNIPWKTEFEWDDERTCCAKWQIERNPDTSPEFDITIKIDISGDEQKHYEYTVPYKDMCYAVADACTKALKKHGFLGFHKATFYEDMSIRYLLLIKAIALGNLEACEVQSFEEIKGEAERSDLMKELELLLFDMS